MPKFEKEIKILPAGSEFYVNAINLSMKAFEYLKSAIKNKTILVSDETCNVFSKDEAVQEKVKSGEIIAPQGFYVKG